MKPVKNQSQSPANRNHPRIKTAGAAFVLLLTLAQEVWAQTTNGFTHSSPLTTTTNGIILIKPVAVSLPDHTASIAYPLDTTRNAPAGSPAAASGPATAPAWTRGIATSINGGDASDHQARLKWVESH